jgi:hypothetical protein
MVSRYLTIALPAQAAAEIIDDRDIVQANRHRHAGLRRLRGCTAPECAGLGPGRDAGSGQRLGAAITGPFGIECASRPLYAGPTRIFHDSSSAIPDGGGVCYLYHPYLISALY